MFAELIGNTPTCEQARCLVESVTVVNKAAASAVPESSAAESVANRGVSLRRGRITMPTKIIPTDINSSAFRSECVNCTATTSNCPERSPYVIIDMAGDGITQQFHCLRTEVPKNNSQEYIGGGGVCKTPPAQTQGP